VSWVSLSKEKQAAQACCIEGLLGGVENKAQPTIPANDFPEIFALFPISRRTEGIGP
jgi:hypothetical protein